VAESIENRGLVKLPGSLQAHPMIASASEFRDIFNHMGTPPFDNIRNLLTTSGYYHSFLKFVKVFRIRIFG